MLIVCCPSWTRPCRRKRNSATPRSTAKALGLLARQVAEKFGRSHQAVKQFAVRNADEIDAAKRQECDRIDAWATKKQDRLLLFVIRSSK
jgi:hypothetical protein